MNLTILINDTYEEEKALYDEEKKIIIAKGDYYHDKINEHIDGIIAGIIYCGIEVKVNRKTIKPKDKLFKACEFYYCKD